MPDITIKVNNTEKFIKNVKEKAEKALEACGIQAQGYAIDDCPVDTGALRNSITYQVREESETSHVMELGTPVKYAPYVEMGTGAYYAGGRKTSWVYQDEDGNWHRTNGQPAKPFIKPAISKHVNEYKKIIQNILNEE